MMNYWVKCCWETRCSQNLQVSAPTDESWTTKGKGNFIWERAGGNHLNQVMKLSISGSADSTHREGCTPLSWPLAKTFNQNLIIRKQSDRSKLRGILQDTQSELFKISILWKQRRQGDYSRREGARETWQQNSMPNSLVDLGSGEKNAMKDILRGNWRNLNGECLLDNIVSMLNLSDVIMALWFFWRMCDKVFKCLGVYSVLTYGSTK